MSTYLLSPKVSDFSLIVVYDAGFAREDLKARIELDLDTRSLGGIFAIL